MDLREQITRAIQSVASEYGWYGDPAVDLVWPLVEDALINVWDEGYVAGNQASRFETMDNPYRKDAP